MPFSACKGQQECDWGFTDVPVLCYSEVAGSAVLFLTAKVSRSVTGASRRSRPRHSD